MNRLVLRKSGAFWLFSDGRSAEDDIRNFAEIDVLNWSIYTFQRIY